MYCPKCGAKLPESVKFCTKCGASLQLLDNSSNPPSSQTTSSETTYQYNTSKIQELSSDYSTSEKNATDHDHIDREVGGAYAVWMIIAQAIAVVLLWIMVVSMARSWAYMLMPESNSTIVSFIALAGCAYLAGLIVDARYLAKKDIRGTWKIWGIIPPVYLFIRAAKTNRKYVLVTVSLALFVFGCLAMIPGPTLAKVFYPDAPALGEDTSIAREQVSPSVEPVAESTPVHEENTPTLRPHVTPAVWADDYVPSSTPTSIAFSNSASEWFIGTWVGCTPESEGYVATITPTGGSTYSVEIIMQNPTPDDIMGYILEGELTSSGIILCEGYYYWNRGSHPITGQLTQDGEDTLSWHDEDQASLHFAPEGMSDADVVVEPVRSVNGFDANGFVFADSSERYLTDADLAGLDDNMLGFARNEIFARNGNLFRSDKYISHYNQYSWYTSMPNKRYDISPEELNNIEQANIKLIQTYESGQG